jgi:cysteine sulfinate desulfinase/cysteine desulfurase/selenocysteine lyase
MPAWRGFLPPSPDRERDLTDDPGTWRKHFPALGQRVDGHQLVYLDTAATAQRPRQVLDALTMFYAHDNANPSKSLHALARRADARYHAARRAVARFINAADPLEIVWTRGTTEGINLVATAWGGANLRRGDEVLLTVAEHASSMLPWQLAARRAGATVRYVDVDDAGRIPPEAVARLLGPRTRVVCFTHVSNVTGHITPAAEICRLARAAGAMVMIDAAQSVPHFAVDVQQLGCDFMAFSGHKMMGPMGIGVLWGRGELLEAMPPYQAGSNMAHDVTLDSAELSPGALRFGAGTPNASGPVGLAAAVHFIETIDYPALWRHEQVLTRHFLARLRDIPRLRLLGPPEPDQRVSVFSLNPRGITPLELMAALDRRGIAVRAGDMAALPLLRRLGAERAFRASLFLYNTSAEIDLFFDVLAQELPGT